MEVWKSVPGMEGAYEVSNLGRMRSLDREVPYSDGRRKPAKLKGVLLGGIVGKNGYKAIAFPDKSKRLVHRIVAEVFLDPPDYTRRIVNHKNGDKLDNRAENLEWSSYAENNSHARSTGLQNQFSERCNLTKFSPSLIAAMRKVHAEYKPTYKKLGELFGTSTTHAYQVINGETRSRG